MTLPHTIRRNKMTTTEQAVAIKMIVAGSRVLGYLKGIGDDNLPEGYKDDLAKALVMLTEIASRKTE